jgi:hypothetical protein
LVAHFSEDNTWGLVAQRALPADSLDSGEQYTYSSEIREQEGHMEYWQYFRSGQQV